MEDFQSKYSGEQVEEFLDQIANGGAGGGGGITVEADPVFSASPAASITEEKKAEWDNKVDKVSGKQLSTEDFTSALKTKLEGLSNYDDEEIQSALSSLQTQFNTLVSGNASDAINSFNEIIAFLDGVKDTEDLSSIIASIEQQIAGKMDKVTLANVATSGSYDDLSNKPNIPSAVTESTVSGWGFTKNAGTYSKPSTGIPKSDLASAVQTSLGKADTALQSYTEQYKGTVTKVKINGSEKTPDSNGVVDLGTIEGGGSSSGGGGSSDSGKKEIVWLAGTVNNMRPNVIYVTDGNPVIEIRSFQPAEEGVDSYDVFTVTGRLMANGAGYDTLIPIQLTLPDYLQWANGQIPVIPDGFEDFCFELSISRFSDGYGMDLYNAVLSQFKMP